MDSISTGNKNGIILEEYKGNYSIAAQRESNDGRFFTQWAKPQIGKDLYGDKAQPVKINLGNKETAIGALKMILKELGEEGFDRPIQPIDEKDIPF